MAGARDDSRRIRDRSGGKEKEEKEKVEERKGAKEEERGTIYRLERLLVPVFLTSLRVLTSSNRTVALQLSVSPSSISLSFSVILKLL